VIVSGGPQKSLNSLGKARTPKTNKVTSVSGSAQIASGYEESRCGGLVDRMALMS
jgi:hypothetical protein